MSKKILIADDEEKIRELIRTSLELEEEGFEIHEAKNGDEAIKKAKEIKPELLILDIMMPGKSGYQVCKELKSNPDTKNIYILFLTARGSEISERTIEMSGGDEFMAKPFSPKQLSFRVRKALGML